MSDPKASQEPSMEEILASIRRIISEDDQEQPADGDKSAEEPVAEEVAADAGEAAPGPEAEADPAEQAASAADSEAAPAEPKPDGEPDSADVFDLTEMVEDDGSVVNLADAKADAEAATQPEKTADEAAMLAPEQGLEQGPEQEAEPGPALEPDPMREASPAQAAAPAGLMEEAAVAAAAAPLANLMQSVDAQHGGTLIGPGGRTIEDLVKEVMRPMVKEWLDANLPTLVERLVRKEIDRVARRSEDT